MGGQSSKQEYYARAGAGVATRTTARRTWYLYHTSTASVQGYFHKESTGLYFWLATGISMKDETRRLIKERTTAEVESEDEEGRGRETKVSCRFLVLARK